MQRNQTDREPDTSVDDLFDYDAGLDEILGGIEQSQQTDPSNSAKNGNAGGAGLGLDEEIKVAPKRQPIAKLDETRLLSQAGIPKLRRTAKSKLKFKGKGHEFSDAMRLLNFYQLWLDDLYPRAKFADGLAMIEKLGHTKRIQTMRKEWIDEGKPRLYADNNDTSNDISPTPNAEGTPPTNIENAISPNEEETTSLNITVPVRDSRIPIENHNDLGGNEIPSIFGGGAKAPERIFDDDDDLFVRDDQDLLVNNNKDDQDVPEEDELDTLLAETADISPGAGTMISKDPGNKVPPPAPQAAFDDLDAMDDYDF
ncbi:chromosome segregation in meiosis- protein [Onygenales sp. PD_10]|nr:chromosome segregation in meiosis- protein [Onygenales sp. PD_10]